MGDRYILTGAQIGMLMAFLRLDTDETIAKAIQLLRNIEEKQFVGKTSELLLDDCKNVIESMKGS
jgi:hypothetical protein